MLLRAATRALIAAAVAFPSGCQLEFDEALLSEDCGADSEGKACPEGTCHGGACCAGCWDGSQCQVGDSAASCGVAGAECTVCEEPIDACDVGRCVAPRGIVSIAASHSHTCAADRMQTLWCWGKNTEGQVARPIDPAQPALIKPEAVTTGDWVEVGAGGALVGHTCAIHFGGSLWCWGDNSSSQLGLGAGGPAAFSAPTAVNDEVWLHVSLGDQMSCGLKQSGTLWCWGLGTDGRLGLPDSSAVPAMVGVDSDWDRLAAGDRHACAIKQDDTLWCWGANDFGQLGRSGTQGQPGLVETGFAVVAAGPDHTCGIRTDGSLWCWGSNELGQLGLAISGTASTPSLVDDSRAWSAVSAGRAHGCGIAAGELYCWGDNSRGQLGRGTIGGAAASMAPIVGRSDWEQIVSGADHNCAVTRAGLSFCWGAGDHYQHGLSTDQDVPQPSALSLSVGAGQ